MDYTSPFRGSVPHAEYYYSGIPSPTPTPSPRHNHFTYPPTTPQRPQTRAHFRHTSSGQYDYKTPFSPRYTSTGEYATGYGPKVSSSRKHSFSWGTPHTPKTERRRNNSYSYQRTSYGDSDEDEVIEVDGYTYVLPAQRKSHRHHDFYYTPGHGADYDPYAQDPVFEQEWAAYYTDAPSRSKPRTTPTRRASTTVPPPRPATTRPSPSRPSRSSRPSHRKSSQPQKATEADAAAWHIPAGYSLKNWDPSEEPILLLGSVFDSNSLGKWIFDWTVFSHGAGTPISEVAGELWLLLIQLSGNIKRGDDCYPRIRSRTTQDKVDRAVKAGSKLLDNFRELLKRCEAPMLMARTDKTTTQLGKGAGVEFVQTLFGRERELDKTDIYMASVRHWNFAFEDDFGDVLRKHST